MKLVWVTGCIAAVLIGLLAVVGIRSLRPSVHLSPPAAEQATSVNQTDIDSFVSRSGIVLPPSAQVTHYHELGGWGDARIDVRIELAAADLDAFITQSGLSGELTNTTRPKAFSVVYAPLLDRTPTKFLEGQKELPNDEWLNVLIDQDSPTTVVAYLIWFEV